MSSAIGQETLGVSARIRKRGGCKCVQAAVAAWSLCTNSYLTCCSRLLLSRCFRRGSMVRVGSGVVLMPAFSTSAEAGRTQTEVS